MRLMYLWKARLTCPAPKGARDVQCFVFINACSQWVVVSLLYVWQNPCYPSLQRLSACMLLGLYTRIWCWIYGSGRRRFHFSQNFFAFVALSADMRIFLTTHWSLRCVGKTRRCQVKTYLAHSLRRSFVLLFCNFICGKQNLPIFLRCFSSLLFFAFVLEHWPADFHLNP